MNERLETYTMTPEQEIKWLRKCVRELQEKREKFIQWLIDYRYNATGSHEDGRYCVAISVTDLLKKIEEL